jgi:hypothetical protein
MDTATFLQYYSTARKNAIIQANILAGFQAIGISPFNPDFVLNSLRPATPPSQLTLSLSSGESLTLNLHTGNPQTLTEITKLIEKYVHNTPAKELRALCESVLASNALLSKANSELVANARGSKKPGKKLNTRARYLTKEVAQQLRVKDAAKEDAKREAVAAKANKRAEQAANKAQSDQARKDRYVERKQAKDLRSEWDRLAKIYKNYNS